MKKHISTLPNFINTPFGLRDKLAELSRELPIRDRADGLRLEYREGAGIVFNQKTGVELGRYTQATDNKYKLTILTPKGVA